jgi:MarR family transcriptional regulator, organic hydroperoxide resistance regulator
LLKKLETQNLVTRVRSLSDERNVVIKLTNKGHELKSNAKMVPWDLICSTNLKTDNTSNLLSTLHSIMDQITENE